MITVGFAAMAMSLGAQAQDAAAKLEAAPKSFAVRFGPFVGSGTTSTDTKIRHSSGYSIEGEQLWRVGKKWAVGPHLSFTNSYISTKSQTVSQVTEQAPAVNTIGVYDARAFAAGVATRYQPDTSSEAHLFLTAAAGQTFAKLSYDESAQDLFVQSQFHNIDGTYGTAQIGGYIPLRESFGIVVAAHSQVLTLDQSDLKGTFSGEQLVDGNAFALNGTYAEPQLDDSIVIRNYNVRLGLTLSL